MPSTPKKLYPGSETEGARGNFDGSGLDDTYMSTVLDFHKSRENLFDIR